MPINEMLRENMEREQGLQMQVRHMCSIFLGVVVPLVPGTVGKSNTPKPFPPRL